MQTNQVKGRDGSGYEGLRGTIVRRSSDNLDAYVEWANHPDMAVAGSWVAVENLIFIFL